MEFEPSFDISNIARNFLRRGAEQGDGYIFDKEGTQLYKATTYQTAHYKIHPSWQ